MMQMTNIIGILVGVAIVAGLLLAMAKMSEKGADANGCGGSCSSCGISQSCRSCVSSEEKTDITGK